MTEARRDAEPCKAWGVNYLKPCVPSATHQAFGSPRCVYCKGFVHVR